MREKEAIEICGAIDTDPAKVGRDLGEVVSASDAPWGIKISADADDVLEQAADVVIHSTSSSLPKVMDQLLACLKAESCVVSTCEELSYPFRTYPDLAAKLDAEAKDWGVALVGTGVNPGFVMDKLVVTLAAVSQRIEHARALRIVDASTRRLPLQKKIGTGLTIDEFRQWSGLHRSSFAEASGAWMRRRCAMPWRARFVATRQRESRRVCPLQSRDLRRFLPA